MNLVNNEKVRKFFYGNLANHLTYFICIKIRVDLKIVLNFNDLQIPVINAKLFICL